MYCNCSNNFLMKKQRNPVLMTYDEKIEDMQIQLKNKEGFWCFSVYDFRIN